MEVKKIGQMDNTMDNTYESANRVYSDTGLCPTIPTCSGGGLQPKIIDVGFMDNGTGKHQSNTVYSCNGISPNITTIEGGGTQQIKILEKPRYRIRKLTPMECGRLMGVTDEDIGKMAAVNSNTQLYKQFGNSIVVDVMCEMFKNLGIVQKGEKR